MSEKEGFIGRKGRKATSIWIDRSQWDEFKENCRRSGQSTCHVLEAFIYGFNKSLSTSGGPILYSLPKVEVNLQVTREVRRARRVERPYVDMRQMDRLGQLHVDKEVKKGRR